MSVISQPAAKLFSDATAGPAVRVRSRPGRGPRDPRRGAGWAGHEAAGGHRMRDGPGGLGGEVSVRILRPQPLPGGEVLLGHDPRSLRDGHTVCF
jgi:hypothetical protein